jgi:hypothetical protein
MAESSLADLVRLAKLADRTDRLMLSDAFEAAGRTEEAGLLRGEDQVVCWDGSIVPALAVTELGWGEEPSCPWCGATGARMAL